ncbi:helix-turn-helix domain-containing protein [Gracilibacillus xinjiangensis]|uniref:Helix-turn-helix domain-containing protein n=1 Tax=Gracilibacillus xinjiangensis TaxID=1193282 RepID=A0ABV8WTR6_9BACI
MDYSHFSRHDVLIYDMRSFYASVECVSRGLDPNKAMLAVVGDPNRSGSIILAASPALKKKYGISNVSRFFELPNDPNIVIAKARMGTYVNVSSEITKMMMTLFPKEAIHVYSIDECWIVMDGMSSHYGTPFQAAQLIKDRIYDLFGLPSVVGIGDNKHLYEEITVSKLAKETILHPNYLSKLFKKEVGSSISEYIQKQKVEEAKKLLAHSDYSLSDIYTWLNFHDQSHFTRVFKKYVGVTPRKYRVYQR